MTADHYVRTETEEPGQFYDGPPIPVHIETDARLVREDATPRASYSSYSITGADTQATRILPRQPLRKEAIIFIAVAAGTPLITIGYDPDQVFQGIGFRFSAGVGTSLTIKNQRAVYAFCAAPAGTATVSVLDQMYETNPEG